jgi:hypothetical protein
MPKAMYLFFLTLLASAAASASAECPVMLVTGSADADAISIAFRNTAKLPIRRLEFDCRLADARTAKASPTRCYEPNASFLPKVEYTVNYSYPPGKRGPMLVSLKTITFADGTTWKPSKKDVCRTLRIALPRATQKTAQGATH